jgi:DHA1 family bicyclomycin/chloramphenicol resistance-like MFS transporter
MSQKQSYRGLPLSLIVAALATLAPFTIDTYLPSFPDISIDLTASHAQMQLTLSLYLLASAIATLIYGPLSDGFGRRKVIMGALIIYMLASIGCALAANIETLILLRIGQGLAASAGMVIGRAMIRDIYHGAEAQKVMARVMLLFAIAPAIAPVIGGFLHDWLGWHSVFIFLSLVATALFMMMWLGCSETLDHDKRHSVHPADILRAYGMALRNRRYLMLVISFALTFSGFFIYIAGAPAVIYDFLGLGVNDFWMMFVPIVASIMIGAQLSGWLAERLPAERIVYLGISLFVTASLLNLILSMWLDASILTVVAPISLYVLGMSISMPNITLMALDCFPHNRGMASALQSFVQMGLTSLVIGMVVPVVAIAMPYMALTMLLLSTAGAWLWVAR